MSYIRPVKFEELKEWLVSKGIHVKDAENLAWELMDRFEIITKASTL